MFKEYSKVGIWGLGVVGKSLIQFLRQHHPTLKLAVLDSKQLSYDDQLFLDNSACILYTSDDIQIFLEQCEVIVPSPGIDLRPYHVYMHKFVHEVDIFFKLWSKKVIGITGTVGKTTITQLTTQLLKSAGLRVATGGNIGTALLDLMQTQEQSDIAVLELSSFQLEYTKECKPDIAVITNLFPNHLDRHGSLEDYLSAKLNITRYQNPEQKVIIHHELYGKCKDLLSHNNVILVSDRPINYPEVACYYQDGASVIYAFHDSRRTLLDTIPDISYSLNWVIMAAVCDSLHVPLLIDSISRQDLPEHRLDLIQEIDGCAFFDDSKSTIMQATLAAVQKIKHLDTVLLLGGVSKGVDRSIYFKQLQSQVKEIICFGQEAAQLAMHAQQYQIKTAQAPTLEEAFALAIKHKSLYTKPAILLSPGGASFDLFADYKSRGKRFNELVFNYTKKFAKEANSL